MVWNPAKYYPAGESLAYDFTSIYSLGTEAIGKQYTFSTQAVNSLNDINKATIHIMDHTTTKNVTDVIAIPTDGSRQSVTFTGPTDSSYYPLKILLYNGEAGWRSQNNPTNYQIGDWNDTNYYYNALYPGTHKEYHGSRPFGNSVPNPNIYIPVEDVTNISTAYPHLHSNVKVDYGIVGVESGYAARLQIYDACSSPTYDVYLPAGDYTYSVRVWPSWTDNQQPLVFYVNSKKHANVSYSITGHSSQLIVAKDQSVIYANCKNRDWNELYFTLHIPKDSWVSPRFEIYGGQNGFIYVTCNKLEKGDKVTPYVFWKK